MPENNNELIEARIAALVLEFTSKLAMVEQKIESGTRATEQGFEYIGKILDQRFAQSDQKSEHASRETRQSIEFLTEQLKATMMDQSATATKVGFLETDVERLKERVKVLEKEVDDRASAQELTDVKENIQWHYRKFAGVVIVAIAGGALAMLQIAN